MKILTFVLLSSSYFSLNIRNLFKNPHCDKPGAKDAMLKFNSLLAKRVFSNAEHDSAVLKASLNLIEETVKANPVVLFMKGSAERPMCGFSRNVIQVLNQFPTLPRYTTVNVLADERVREAIKIYSKWPTIPQLYVKGDFVGGCDIVVEMYRNGTLAKLLESLESLEAEKSSK